MKEDCEYAIETQCKCDASKYDIKNCSGKGTGQLYKYKECRFRIEEYKTCILEDIHQQLTEMEDLCCIQALKHYCQDEAMQCMREVLVSLPDYHEDFFENKKRYGNLPFDCMSRSYYNSDNCTDPVVFSGGAAFVPFVVFDVLLTFFAYSW